ncbi:MAG: molybdopterin-dependent oxidoreductase, partial [Boseongicola sp.]|nr:molybdopterin-dependent oxidoreductase [Boseongicola sp.]
LEALAQCYAEQQEVSEIVGAGGSKKWENRPTLTGGFTDAGVDERESFAFIHHTISVRDVPELRGWRVDSEGNLVLGAAISISELTRIPDALAEDADAFAAHSVSLRALKTQARYFANENVRHTGSIGGGLASCHHLSDMLPVWVALDASIELLSQTKGSRLVSLKELLSVEDARLKLENDDVIVSISLPPRDPNEFVAETFKQAIRRTDSMALVSAAMTATRDGNGGMKDVRLVFGGLGAPGLRASSTEALLEADNCQTLAQDEERLAAVLADLRMEIDKINIRALPQEMREYQCEVAAGFLKRFMHMSAPSRNDFADTERFKQPPSRGRQTFEKNTDKEAIIGRALAHLYVPQHTRGETRYTVDEQLPEEGLHAAIVAAPIACGTLVQIDASPVEGQRDYVGIITAEDIPGSNFQGHMVHPLAEEEILCSSRITHFGQPVALVLAKTELGARRLAAKVRVVAKPDPEPPILTFDDIVDRDSWFSFEHLPASPDKEAKERRLVRGNPAGIFGKAKRDNDRYLMLSGQEEVGAQSCFYLEPQCAVAMPQSDGRIRVRSSTQSPSHVARYVAAALGLEQHKVDVEAGFIGGGFGGKQTRSASFAAMAAIAARKMDQPVKIELSRETDMALVPGRSPFRADYKIALDRKTGRIEALEIDMIVNGGSGEDYSPSIAETSIFLIDNAYQIANADIRARCGRSNLPAGFTATRGYGKPQTGAIIEKILDDAAAHLDMDPQDLRKENLYSKGQRALAETPIDDEVLRSCWTSAVDQNYADWRECCSSFNTKNSILKRGVAGIPSKGNMGFMEASDINRGSAIVRLHSDGSVRISHSGVEMGQGLNTRMSQVASYALSIPIEKVSIDPTRTSDLPNTPPTTMVATDMIGAAIMNACDELLETLGRAGYPGKVDFSEATQRCYDEGWPMEATGHAQEPRLRFDWEKQQGDVSYFFVWGAALAEAEIDLSTGSWRIMRTHITQDCGTSLNPMLDIGQVEGGFAFGIGYSLLEKTIYRQDGSLLTDNVSSYKIPSIDDMPRDWTIEILQETAGPPGRRGLHNSKGVGEANIQLGFSAYFAVKDAIRSARRDTGLDPTAFSLPFPAMPHDILKACK